MRLRHDSGKNGFEIWFGRAPLLKRKKIGTRILLVILIVISGLYIVALKNKISAFPSKRISSVVKTWTNDSYSRLMPKFAPCTNFKRSDWYDVLGKRLLVAWHTVRKPLTSTFSTARLSLVHGWDCLLCTLTCCADPCRCPRLGAFCSWGSNNFSGFKISFF